ncbi:MAG: MFS transporter [Thiotrichales bacterium]
MNAVALTVPRLLAYGLPAAPLALLGLPLYVYVPSFYAETLGLSLAGVGVVLLVARLLDVITDPVVGVLSDRWPGRYRRKAVMALGIPLLLVGLGLLFQPAPGSGLVALGFAAALTYLGWTLVSVPYHAWGAELECDYHARTRLASVRELFVLAGTLLALGIPTLLGIAGDRGATLGFFGSALPWLLLPAAVLAALLVPEATTHPAERTPFRLIAAWQGVIANPSMRRLMPAYFINGIANAVPATLFLMFVSQVVQADAAAGLLLTSYFVAAILGLPLWWWLAKRFGKHRTWSGAMLFCAAVFASVPFLVGPGDVTVFAIICVLTGFTLGADVALPASMQADVVESDAMRTRQSRAAMLFGLWGMLTKLALALAVGVVFPVLALAGFDPRGANTGSGLLALTLLYSLLPVLIKLAAIALMWRFPLDASALERLRRSSFDGDSSNGSIQFDMAARSAASDGVRANAP